MPLGHLPRDSKECDAKLELAAPTYADIRE